MAISRTKSDIENPKSTDAALPNFVSGLACDGNTLYALNNEAGPSTEWKGSVSEIDLVTGQSRGKIAVGGFPLSVAVAKDDTARTRRSGSLPSKDGVVSYWHPGARFAEDLRVGANPTCLTVCVATRCMFRMPESDRISVVDTTNHVVSKNHLGEAAADARLRFVRPSASMFPPTARPSTRSGDMNAIAIVDLAKGVVNGYVPVGWYPTDVKLTADGKRLFVSNAKGVDVRIPNGEALSKSSALISRTSSKHRLDACRRRHNPTATGVDPEGLSCQPHRVRHRSEDPILSYVRFSLMM